MNGERELKEVERGLRNGMTVADLRRELEGMDDDAVVVFTCNYGDYHRTQQALTVSEVLEVEPNAIYSTAYSQSGLAFRDEDREEDEDEELDAEELEAKKALLEAYEELPQVVVLR